MLMGDDLSMNHNKLGQKFNYYSLFGRNIILTEHTSYADEVSILFTFTKKLFL